MTGLSAATATTDITPENGEDLCGYAARGGKPTAGIHDRLFSRWLYLQNAGHRFLLGSNDLISFSRGFTLDLRRDLALATPLKAREVVVTATHTHSGPATYRLRSCGRPNSSYIRTLKERLREAGRKSVTAPKPATLTVATAEADWGFNRRHPDHGTVDKQVVILSLSDSRTDEPIATLCHYACHPVVMGACNLHVSADYPGYLQQHLAAETGAPCLFLNGACGDIDPRTRDSAHFEDAEVMGKGLARTALKALKRSVPLGQVQPQTFRAVAALPVAVPNRETVFDERLEAIGKAFELPVNSFHSVLESQKRQWRAGKYPRSVSAELTLLTLGQKLALLFIPGEVLVDLGLELKRRSPFEHTLICGFANGAVGYLPTRKAYTEGGYEPYWAPFFYRFPEFSPAVEDAILETAGTLYRQALSR